MKTANFQHHMDLLIKKLFLWAIPKKITPNMLSILRLALIPLLIYLLITGQISYGLIVFMIAALTDALDGAMARTRNQITNLGKVLDPIADKALIGTMLAFFGFEYLIVKIFLVFIAGEIFAVATSFLLSKKFGRPIGANVYGKVKMVLQTLAVFVFALGLLLKNQLFINASEYILFVALFFAVLAGIEVVRRKWPKIMEVIKS